MYDRCRGVVIAYGTEKRITIVRGELGMAIELLEDHDLRPINRRSGVVPNWKNPAWKRRQVAKSQRGAIPECTVSIKLAGL